MPRKSVLIISPRFPPSNAADCHRIRLSVKHYIKFGWRPVVLCCADSPADSDDWRLFHDVAQHVEVVRVRPWSVSFCKIFGFQQIEFRSFFPLLVVGLRLIFKTQSSVAFFSTTAFATFLLGPIWKALTKIRLVYDVQDPWYHGTVLPYDSGNSPGSWRKYRLVQLLAKFGEPIVMPRADQIISVSQNYIETLIHRYSIAREKLTLLPFPGAYEDFFLACDAKQEIFDKNDGRIHWVYAGRAGPDLEFAITAFFRGLKTVVHKRPELRNSLTVHFVGTNYAPSQRSYEVVQPIAVREGIADLVSEHPGRIRYLDVLDLYKSADVLLIFGSEKAEYTASKLINCLLAQRPLFALFHKDSLVDEILQQFPEVFGSSFSDDLTNMRRDVVAEIERVLDRPVVTDTLDVTRWLPLENAKVQCAIFDKAIN